MSYQLNKKRLPRKSNDTTIIKCILRSIHDHFHVDADILNVSKEKYNSYYDYLEQLNIIKNVSTKYTPEGYSVLDSKKYKTFLNSKDLSVQFKLSVPFVDLSVDLNTNGAAVSSTVTKK